MAALIFAIIRYCIVGAGIFAGFYFYFGHNIPLAVGIVTLTCAGLVGILSFFSHVVFHKSDAIRLGLDPEKAAFFQREVGFANMAIGLIALLAFLLNWGPLAQGMMLGCYSLYLFQALLLHLWRYIKGEHRTAAYLWLSIVLSAVYVGMMTFFAIAGITFK
jgi:hypothetical protein